MTPHPFYAPQPVINNSRLAFNAFTLGFADCYLRGELGAVITTPAYQSLFTIMVSKLKLGGELAENIHEYMTRHAGNPEQLQNDLAPIFQEIAVELLNPDQLYDEFVDAFLDYLHLIKRNPATRNPAFSVRFSHLPRFKDAFHAIYTCLAEQEPEIFFIKDEEQQEQQIVEAVREQLHDTWYQGGFAAFQHELSTTGSNGSYLDLQNLAKHFDLAVTTVANFSHVPQTWRARWFCVCMTQNNVWHYMQDMNTSALKFSAVQSTAAQPTEEPLQLAVLRHLSALPKLPSITLPNTHRLIDSVGDGNCAFNTFVLGFCDLVLRGALEPYLGTPVYQDFADLACKYLTLKPACWDSLKVYIKGCEHNIELLQKRLAPVFRELAVQQYEQINLEEHLTAEFREVVYRLVKKPSPETGFRGGDIFKRIRVISDKFRQIADIFSESSYEAFDLDTFNDLIGGCIEQLLEWWREEGLILFKSVMLQSGEWAGDMELAYLGHRFGLNVKLFQDQKFRSITESYGALPVEHGLVPETVAQLIQRGIMKPDANESGQFEFREMTEEELRVRMNEVMFHEAILEHFLSKPSSGPIHPDWIPSLKSREIVSQKDGVYFYISDIDFDTLFARLCTLDEKQTTQVFELYRAHYKPKPCVAFSNPRTAHWYYVQEVENAILKPPTSPRLPYRMRLSQTHVELEPSFDSQGFVFF